MTREELKEWLINNFGEKIITSQQTIKNKFSNIYNEIINQTVYLDENSKYTERLYHIINDLFEVPICKNCEKNKTNFNSYIKGYLNYCSNKCATNSDKVKNKRKNSLIEKYGVDNISKSDYFKEKYKETCIERYGVENVSQSQNIKNKVKKTNLKKYGCEYIFQSEEIKNKIKDIIIDKYGVDNISKSDYFKEKFKETCIDRYDSNHFMISSDKIKEKIKKTNLKRYGVKTNLQILNIKKSAIKGKKITSDNTIIDLLNKNFKNSIEYINRISMGKYNVKCNICLNEFSILYSYIKYYENICPFCNPKLKSSSKIEKEVVDFIKSIIDSEIIENSRSIISPKELDIYIPNKNIAIEINGVYWHSEQFHNSSYHISKTNECEKQNIQLIHIFEDEWIFKKDIVKSRLKQILNVNNIERIHARKCQIKEIDSKTKNEFLEKYHIQGKDNASIKLGAFYNDELVSVMTFSHGNISKGSKKKEYVYELNRFATNNAYHIPGIASKLLHYFKCNYDWEQIFSYADRRWSQGNLYHKLGFEFDSYTQPNYWYTKDGIKRIHRFALRKRPDEPKDISERILREQEGYYRIWDCGNLKFVINKEI